MAEIKSAIEKAMEKAERFGRATPEEMRESVYLDEGKRLAARYLREDQLQILALLEAQPGPSRSQIRKGMEETLLRNIVLPRDEGTEDTVDRAMGGYLKLNKNHVRAQKALGKIGEIIRHYKRTVEEARIQLKSRFETKLEGMQRHLQEQLRMSVDVDVEHQPQFQEQWLQVSGEIDAHYSDLLDQQKEILKTL